jgi:integrase
METQTARRAVGGAEKKGQKDRTVPLPEMILPELRKHLEFVRDLHQRDLARNYDRVFLMNSLDRKYKNAAKDFIWQWFFPARQLTYVEATGEHRRYHLHETHMQRAIKQAVTEAAVPKRASAHTFRHYAEPFTAGKLRYPDDPRIIGVQRCQDDHDLHPYREKQDHQGGKSPLDFGYGEGNER